MIERIKLSTRVGVGFATVALAAVLVGCVVPMAPLPPPVYVDDGVAAPAPEVAPAPAPAPSPPSATTNRQALYYYYPNVEVYYGPDTGYYYWYEDGNWHYGARVPGWDSDNRRSGAPEAPLRAALLSPLDGRQPVRLRQDTLLLLPPRRGVLQPHRRGVVLVPQWALDERILAAGIHQHRLPLLRGNQPALHTALLPPRLHPAQTIPRSRSYSRRSAPTFPAPPPAYTPPLPPGIRGPHTGSRSGSRGGHGSSTGHGSGPPTSGPPSVGPPSSGHGSGSSSGFG